MLYRSSWSEKIKLIVTWSLQLHLGISQKFWHQWGSSDRNTRSYSPQIKPAITPSYQRGESFRSSKLLVQMHQVYIVNPGKIQALITRCRPTASPITRVNTLSVGNNHLDPVQLKLPRLMPCDCWPKVWAKLATKHDVLLLNPSSTPPELFRNFPRPHQTRCSRCSSDNIKLGEVEPFCGALL